MRVKRSWAARSLVAGMGFWSVMAFVGSPGLMFAAEGPAMNFDTAWLQNTPFSDYVLPGVILGLLGAGGAIVTALLVRGLRAQSRRGAPSSWQWYFAMVVALGHLGWIVGEIVLMWSPVTVLPAEQKAFFYGFWWVFGLLSTANLLLVFSPSTRRILGGPAGR
ncbi:hypothetical protein ACQR3Q_15810 [Dietzia natronolimnaea]|uniref:hypothetical protein n=1 Tax=Dietzia natronolimnaea TaxID=161920 RepID=UPI003D1504DC